MKIIKATNHYVAKLGQLVPDWIIALALRVSLFYVFWNSAQHKIYGLTVLGQHLAFWNVTDSTLMLFEFQYKIPLLPPTVAAYMATLAEFFFSIGLLLGLFTRLSAIGLLILLLVIQIFVDPGYWPTLLLWAGGLLYLLRHGAAVVSVDHLVGNR
ncbi:hypothetical protein TDB9533_03935 [Thalassocella blandensis]|nr:hypothetical protein TDB9533_03935 [Thalassocella blandensis]